MILSKNDLNPGDLPWTWKTSGQLFSILPKCNPFYSCPFVSIHLFPFVVQQFQLVISMFHSTFWTFWMLWNCIIFHDVAPSNCVTFLFIFSNRNVMVFWNKNNWKNYMCTEFPSKSFSLLTTFTSGGVQNRTSKETGDSRTDVNTRTKFFQGPIFFFFLRSRSCRNSFWDVLYLVAIIQKTKRNFYQ